MAMVYCRACAKELHESAPNCVHCGAPQALAPAASKDTIPDGVRGWSWGAFLLNWIWAIGNRSWIGLLALLPYVGFIVAIWLGFQGREMAWKNCQWRDLEHFNRVQREWTKWSLVFVGVITIVMFAAMVTLGAAFRSHPIAAQAGVERAVIEQAGAAAVDDEAPASEPVVKKM